MITLSWGKANDVKGWRHPDVKKHSKVKNFDNIKEQQNFIVCWYYVKIPLSRLLTVDQFDLRDVTLARENFGGIKEIGSWLKFNLHICLDSH